MNGAAKLVLALALLTPAQLLAATNSADVQRFSHNCPTYPPAAVRNNLEGSTIVSFHIDEKGKVSRPTVEQSSGSTVLDAAAKTCVLAWRYPPNSQNARDISKKMRIIWRLTDAPPATQPPSLATQSLPPELAKLNVPKPQPLSFEQPSLSPQTVLADGDHTCMRWYPSQSIREGKEGIAELSFTITADGRVKDIVVAQSSGDERLDQVSIICASFWRYQFTGPKGETAWRTSIDWKLTR
ncbi:MAG: energy transducer TonB [Proteobacteria bacterium]|nr:energy transducer TonB [Pseudomonadota bacterium]